MATFNQLTGSDNPFNGINAGFGYGVADFVDLDNDGDLDAVIGKTSGTLDYYENTGTPTNPVYTLRTGPGTPFNGVDVGGNFSSPALVDMDGDNDLDLFISNTQGVLSYFQNAGTPNSPVFILQTGAANPFNGLSIPTDDDPAAFADLDNDGDQDAVFGEVFGTLKYFENTGDANSPAYVERTGTDNPFDGIDTGFRSYPALVDFDGDGDLDAVIGGSSAPIFYYENTGTANSPAFTLRTGSDSPFNGLNIPSQIDPTLADLDSDGDLDLIIKTASGTLSYFQNTTPPAPTLPTVSLAASDAEATEAGDTATYTLTRTGDTSGDLTVQLDLGFGTDLSAADFNLSGGSITLRGTTAAVVIPAGETAVDITLTATDDIAAEADEALTLTLAEDAAYTIDGSATSAEATIAANDLVVTNTNDSGEGSLRQAILNANAFAGADK